MRLPPRKYLIALAALVVAGVAFFLWRRRAQAAQSSGVSAGTPSPLSAVTGLLAPAPGQPAPNLRQTATNAAVGYIADKLPPVVGAGVNAIIPQSTARPTRNEVAQALSTLPGPTRAANYNPSVGYYG